MKTVLTLSASFGDGHAAAARNLSEALESLSGEVRVEVFDLFESSYGAFHSMARKAYSKVIRLAPSLWGGLSTLRDRSALRDYAGFNVARLQRDLGHLLQDTQPDTVIVTHTLYTTLIRDLYRDHAEHPFRFISLVTDCGGLSAPWLEAAPTDVYFVVDSAAAGALRARGIRGEQIKTLGFPVSPQFCHRPELPLPAPGGENRCRLLCLIDSPGKKPGKALKRLLDHPEYHLTVVVGRNACLKAGLTERLRAHSDRVQVLGWTNQMPSLLRSHHLLIGPPNQTLIQEAIAAQCPMIVCQFGSGQKSASGRTLTELEIGAVAEKPAEVVERVKQACRREAKVWRRWRENLSKVSRPDAALRMAEVVLRECDHTSQNSGRAGLARGANQPVHEKAPGPGVSTHPTRPLLCDFHIHTSYSDGKLSVAEVIDFYGHRQFDCICITDHLADSRRLIGKLGKLSRLTLNPGQLPEYFETIERERRRAWRKYSMLVMTGLEFNKDGLTQKASAHLLGIDLQAPILDCLDLPETIDQIHAQGGLAVASHPHIMKSEWGKNTLYLWEHQERFAPLLDAWEIANRNNVFNPVSAKRLPYLANSDFHKPKHIYSWKTLVSCEKTPAAIKECIRKNERIAITLYREAESGLRQAGEPANVSWSSEEPSPNGAGMVSPLSPAA